MFHHFQLILRKSQTFYNVRVIFHDLRRRKARGHPDIYRMILHLMRHRMNAAVYRPLLAEIHDFGRYLFARNFHNRRNQILNSLILRRTDRNHGNP